MSRSSRRPAGPTLPHELRRHWGALAGLAGIALAAVVVAVLVPHVHLQPGAAVAVPAVAAILLAVTLLGRTHARSSTPLSSRWTVQLLRRMGWRAVASPVPSAADAAVAITPSAVLAVRSVQLRLDRTTEALLSPEIAAAAALAAAVRQHAKDGAEHEASELPVVPAVVVWGAGPAEFASGYRVTHGVHLLDGRRPQLWLHLFSTPPLATAEQRELIGAA